MLIKVWYVEMRFRNRNDEIENRVLGGGGGFQMMTIDDEGEGGVWPMMTSSQKY